MKMRTCLLTLVLATLYLTARCAGEEVANDFNGATPALSTDKSVYYARRTSTAYELSIGTAYTNRSKDTLFVAGCREPDPPWLEKLVEGEWVFAYMPVVDLCGYSPVPIAPGETYRDTFYVAACHPGSGCFPELTVGISGSYRLVRAVYSVFDPDRFRPEVGELVPLEDRISNEFRIKRKLLPW